ncbi:MAG: aminotransferase class I/II-fold pyridoxal phosphate-dependent enzyme [Bacteroidetes bacterium]|nr:aminotransferase class I/II-fold pyridoxal phosphate-dependent enzyme [Bacteroidota bacterium]
MPFHPFINQRVQKYLDQKRPFKESGPTRKIRLHANENGIGSPSLQWYHRFTEDEDMEQFKLAIAGIKNVPKENLFITNGKYYFFELCIRIFCEAEKDKIIFCTPVPDELMDLAKLNGIDYLKVPLTSDQQLDMIHLEKVVNEETKLIWLSSPNHFTGNNMHHEDIETILNNFSGLVILDESYINFSKHRSFLPELKEYPNLCICQNFHYAWGMAGLEVEIAFASVDIISILNQLPFSKHLNKPTMEIIRDALQNIQDVNSNIKTIVAMRNAMGRELEHFSFIDKVYSSDANFLLIKFNNIPLVKEYLKVNQIEIHDLTQEKFYEHCLRISIGSEREIKSLLDVFENIELKLSENVPDK